MAQQPFIIGITGGSASGKSSFARDLKTLFPDDVLTVLNEDNYYLPKERVPVDENGVQNYDTPEAIDHQLYIAHVKELKSGNAIQKEEYTFHRQDIVPRLLTLNPTPLIIVEGIFALHFDEVKELIDLKLYIDVDEQTRFERRIKRDLEERQLYRDEVEYRWKNHIAPRYESTQREYKACADLIILNNTTYQQGLDVISAYLKRIADA